MYYVCARYTTSTLRSFQHHPKPLTSTWPRLRCDVGVDCERKVLQYCVLFTMVHNGTSSSYLYLAVILLGLTLCLPSASVSSVFLVLYILKIKLHILISWAWWDWPLRPGWLTIVLHWLDYLAGKIFLEMTCIKWDGTLCYSQHQLTFPISAMFSVVAPFSHPCTNIVILATLKLWSNVWLIDWLIETTDNE